MNTNTPKLNYDPKRLPRELRRHYISASDDDIKAMLKALGLEKLEDLYADLPRDVFFHHEAEIPGALGYEDLQEHLFEVSLKNKTPLSFIGDGLPQYKVPEISAHVSNIRGLTTAYTPYQPERSQGTLQTLWVYASALSMLTGFEAINASFYDRSTCLFEALNCSLRLVRGADTVIVSRAVYPGDINVLASLAKYTPMKIVMVNIDPKTGLTDYQQLKDVIRSTANLAAVAFAQVNNLGNIEDVDLITDICSENRLQSIAIIDPMLLATGGLKPPAAFGSHKQGPSMIVGEGQQIALGPNFGGPGLGIFGIRYNERNKTAIRSTAGRYVGNGKDAKARKCKVMVLSTREQHIRREKATSNICSNQSFVATLAGAAILARGEGGMEQACRRARENALEAAAKLSQYAGVNLRFPETPFYNEFVIELPLPARALIQKARKDHIHAGVDVSSRLGTGENLLLLSFFDIHSSRDIERLDAFFSSQFAKESRPLKLAAMPDRYLRAGPVHLPNFSTEVLKDFYNRLGDQNVSPDHAIYPLGSCTMKYNPHINDWAASLSGFTDVHPEAPTEDVQGALQILYEIQEIFKEITGLAAVATQPVAGAQGELVSIKMFQAYHQANGEGNKRDIILVPRSAHGTNPATATMAGFETRVVNGKKSGIALIEADSEGRMAWPQLNAVVREFNDRIAGIMVTNPNTAGIFETRFKEISELIHSVGGLVFMDGANMNAIAGWVNLGELGVDAVHSNLHKTWSIPHGGGGPGDAFVAVSEKLVDFLPGLQVKKKADGVFDTFAPEKTIGSFHRHFGNFAHKVRAYTYLRALGPEGIKRMSAVAVLSAKYLHKKLSGIYPTLPSGAERTERMHEFILTISKETFEKIEKAGIHRTQVIPLIGKLFLDFGLHAPTVAFPEVHGLMIEPTESFAKAELDHFVDVVKAIHHLINDNPEILDTVPHFTPVDKVDEVGANRDPDLSERLGPGLPDVIENRIDPGTLRGLSVEGICTRIVEAHKKFYIT
jgi:glycine dehydrogenase